MVVVLHFYFFLRFLLVSLIFFVLSIYSTLVGLSVVVFCDLFSSWFIRLNIRVSLDFYSLWFRFAVSFISSVIMIYSYFYMSPYYKPRYFVWITIFFVVSILVVINFTNMFFLMLGWDGLGLVSFLLIVFYQNQSSITSGLFTVMINRVGDCFFIRSIGYIVLTYPVLTFYNSSINLILSFLLVCTFVTKRAIFPFSAWLPLAIAAPTPISALVHSSTLVTAGLYLCIRFSYLLYRNYILMVFFLIISVFTSFYAGLNSVFEKDMKKLIALSTLSHLGFIGIAFSCGLLSLSFFSFVGSCFF